MGLVDGPDLRRELNTQGNFTPAAACYITDQVLAGLSTVHAVNIVHRDVKPENVLVDRDEQGAARLRITDQAWTWTGTHDERVVACCSIQGPSPAAASKTRSSP